MGWLITPSLKRSATGKLIKFLISVKSPFDHADEILKGLKRRMLKNHTHIKGTKGGGRIFGKDCAETS